MHAGQHTDLGLERAERLRIAVVGAGALGEDGGAVGLVLQILEHDVEVHIAEAAGAEFEREGGMRLGLEELHVGGADVFLEAEDGGGDALGGDDALDDGAGLGRGADEGEVGLRFAGEADELLDRGDDGLDGLVAERERLDEFLLGDLVGGALDHQHVLLVADVDEVERGGEHLLDVRVGDELVVDQRDADAADRPVPRDVGDGEGGAGAVDHRDVGVVDEVG